MIDSENDGLAIVTAPADTCDKTIRCTCSSALKNLQLMIGQWIQAPPNNSLYLTPRREAAQVRRALS